MFRPLSCPDCVFSLLVALFYIACPKIKRYLVWTLSHLTLDCFFHTSNAEFMTLISKYEPSQIFSVLGKEEPSIQFKLEIWESICWYPFPNPQQAVHHQMCPILLLNQHPKAHWHVHAHFNINSNCSDFLPDYCNDHVLFVHSCHLQSAFKL